MMTPTTTNGATIGDRELPTNDIQIAFASFANTPDQFVSFMDSPPETWDGLTVVFAVVWTNPSGLITETIEFDLEGHSYADLDLIDVAPGGTPKAVTQIWAAQNDIRVTPFSTAVTLGGTPVNGQPNIYKLKRDTVADNMTGPCEVLALILRYGIVDQGST